MAPKTKQRGEGKQVLVIFLVFFILLSIGLGVATYYGYAEQEQLRADKKKADQEKKTITSSRDFERFRAMLFLSYMGLLKGDDQQDLAVRKDQFDGNQLGDDAERQALRQVMATNLDQKIKWDPAKKALDKNYEGLLVDARKDYEALEKRAAGLAEEKTKAEARAKAAEDKLQMEQDNYKAELAKFSKKVENDNSDLLKQKDDLLKQLTQINQEKDMLVKKVDEEKKKSEAEVKKLTDDKKTLRGQLDQRQEELTIIKQKGVDAPKDWRTDWRIVRIDPRGTTGYINLGSGDRVNEQLTFSVHGVDLNGKPLPAAKGSVEVVNVIGEHLSQVRITNVRDAYRDPILRNDVLFNPSWNPNLKKHVAITGIIDLTGEGRDTMDEFRRNLERQNIIVDAWLDLREPVSVKGKGITVQTDYLIVGDGQDFISDNKSNAEFRKNVEEKVAQMQAEAGKNGVPIIGLKKYLELIGYRLPRVTSTGPAQYRPTLPKSDVPKEPGKEPGKEPAKEPAKEPEKKDEEKKDDK